MKYVRSDCHEWHQPGGILYQDRCVLCEYIVELDDEFEEAAIHSADGYISNLGHFEFCFLLSTFNELFAHADVLFDIIQNKSFDMQFCMARVEEFCICIEGQRERFD